MDALTFDESKARLEEIANLVEDPDISLDEALALYEEAVKIGLHACDVSEQDLLETASASEGDGAITPEEAGGVIDEAEQANPAPVEGSLGEDA